MDAIVFLLALVLYLFLQSCLAYQILFILLCDLFSACGICIILRSYFLSYFHLNAFYLWPLRISRMFDLVFECKTKTIQKERQIL
uniref:Uncharacterized protein n=1 Tax=Arundo donax TaxID=35708 RepID=A0A0A9B715_ARUDO